MSSPFRPTAPKYTLIMLLTMELSLITSSELSSCHERLDITNTKQSLHKGQIILYTRPLGSLLSWNSPRWNTLDQLDQANQINDPEPGSALSHDFDRVRPGYVCPACRYRPQAPVFVMEIHPISSPVLAVLENFEHPSLPGMEWVCDSAPPHRLGRVGCS